MSKRLVAARTLLFCLATAFLVAGGPAPALEFWKETKPDLPAGAARVTVHRTVHHRDGRAVAPVRKPYTVIEVEPEGSTRQSIHDADGNYLWDLVYRYAGDTIESISAVRDAERWRIVFSHDESGRIRQESFHGAGDSLERTVVYEYGEETAEVIAYRNDGSVAWRRTESAEWGGEQQRTTFYYPDGTRVKTVITETDEDGRPVSERHLDEFGALDQRMSYRYDDGRLVKEVVADSGGRLLVRTEFTYLPAGLLASRTVHKAVDGVEEQLAITYAFDDQGNWVRREEITTVLYSSGSSLTADHVVYERRIDYR